MFGLKLTTIYAVPQPVPLFCAYIPAESDTQAPGTPPSGPPWILNGNQFTLTILGRDARLARRAWHGWVRCQQHSLRLRQPAPCSHRLR
jgi:hypothetical protein